MTTKRHIRQAMERGHYKTLYTVHIPMERDHKMLASDLQQILVKLDLDNRRIIVNTHCVVYPFIELSQNSLILCWLLFNRSQGNVLAPGQSFDEGIEAELKETVSRATDEIVASIDVGNSVAIRSTKEILSADDVSAQLNSAKNPDIAINVTNRARGPQQSFFFNTGETSVGGNHNSPHEFSNAEQYRVQSCSVDRWASDNEIKLTTSCEIEELGTHVKNGSFSARVVRHSHEGRLLDCAALALLEIDLSVSIGLNIKRRRNVLFVTKIHNPVEILDAAQAAIEELKDIYS